MNTHRKLRICVLSGIASVLTHFYSDLLKNILDRGCSLCIISPADEKLLRFTSTMKCEMFPVNITRRMTPASDMLACIRVFLFFLKNRFDIVHMHTPKGGVIGILAAFLARLPVRVYTIHGLPFETASGMSRKLLWLSEKLSCSLASHILAVSDSLRKKIIQEKLCPPDKISVLEHGTACGIDIERFTPSQQTLKAGLQIRRQLGIPDDDLVIGFLGRMTPEKGVDALIHSFLELEASRKDLYLLLVGDIDEVRETFEQGILDTIKLHNRIVHLAFQEDVVPFYAAMDLYVMPTRREGFGMTFLEAGAMNLPVIGSRVTGCVDAVADGQTGFLVTVDAEEELTKMILKLITDKELRFKLGRQGRKRVEKYFCSEKLVKAHLEFYNGLLTRDGSVAKTWNLESYHDEKESAPQKE